MSTPHLQFLQDESTAPRACQKPPFKLSGFRILCRSQYGGCLFEHVVRTTLTGRCCVQQAASFPSHSPRQISFPFLLSTTCFAKHEKGLLSIGLPNGFSGTADISQVLDSVAFLLSRAPKNLRASLLIADWEIVSKSSGEHREDNGKRARKDGALSASDATLVLVQQRVGGTDGRAIEVVRRLITVTALRCRSEDAATTSRSREADNVLDSHSLKTASRLTES